MILIVFLLLVFVVAVLLTLCCDVLSSLLPESDDPACPWPAGRGRIGGGAAAAGPLDDARRGHLGTSDGDDDRAQ